ncbi:MAG: hypothetical protein RJQ08_04880 [Salinisphaeraceae bacterium]
MGLRRVITICTLCLGLMGCSGPPDDDDIAAAVQVATEEALRYQQKMLVGANASDEDRRRQLKMMGMPAGDHIEVSDVTISLTRALENGDYEMISTMTVTIDERVKDQVLRLIMRSDEEGDWRILSAYDIRPGPARAAR